MGKANYPKAAIRDLEQIGDYIANNLKNPAAALCTVEKIQDWAEALADLPRMGAALSAYYENAGDYRFLVSGNYLVFYHQIGDGAYIDRVLYSRRDYLAILFGELPPQDEAE
ncbi:MAG: type II toxin-antitoxin system RelE/ParE family toxin [Clostridiales Family XIII bacterium]|nr:type II toxin-antitoxin system RelE/ParE family toxin [Clostridiales Family XIII bacterium]